MASALLSSFKASTIAISSRSLTRAAPRRLPAMSHVSRRHYSEDKATNGASEQEKKDEKKEDVKADDKSAELAEKLKVKETEVVDLTVSSATSPTSYFIFLTNPLLGPTTIPSGRLCQFAAKLCAREGANA